MKVFRFMSDDEFNKFINGENLVNEKDFSIKSHTDSKGFCFMEFDDNIEYCYEFLSGIVSDDYCCIFETDKSNLNESWGIYADPNGAFSDTITVDEYCTTHYNKDDFKLLKYSKDFSAWTLNEWIDFKENVC